MILTRSTETLLFKPENFKDIYDDLHELHELYASHTGIRAGDINDSDIYLPSGKAISPIKAAFCLMEIQRTAVFIRGINKAILQLKEQFKGEQIHILYAGCGPYATLLTPFTTRFSADEIAFHMLDINEISLDAAKKLYKALEIENYVKEWICADATTYQLPADIPMHLVISETMLNALRKEPQVSIMLNLVPQLSEKALFIPQRIDVSAKLLSWAAESEAMMTAGMVPERKDLGMIYSIGRDVCAPPETVVIDVPQDPGKHTWLNLLTDITVFDDEVLTTNQSSLNMPLKIVDVTGYEGRAIRFTYKMEEMPGFVHEWLHE